MYIIILFEVFELFVKQAKFKLFYSDYQAPFEALVN